MVTQVVGMSDNRTVTVECWGAADGTPVFLLHGTPGSRSGPTPRPSVLYRLGIRLICYDRPGYGGSDSHPGRTVADAAWDVLEIADQLMLDRFSVVGRCGGGPHALACAALLEDRVQCAAVLVGLAPSDAEGLDWYAGMTDSNVDAYKGVDSAVRHADATVRASLKNRAAGVRDDPEILLRLLAPARTGPDRRIIEDVALRQLQTGAAHFGAMEILPSVLAWIKEAGRSEGLRIQSARQAEFPAQHGNVGMVGADQAG